MLGGWLIVYIMNCVVGAEQWARGLCAQTAGGVHRPGLAVQHLPRAARHTLIDFRMKSLEPDMSFTI